MSILLLEDDPAIADTVAFALRREGFDVDHRGWLAEARERLRSGPPPELLILDIGLPDGNGLDLCRDLRNGPLRTLPVIMLSARSDEMDRVLGLELGADDYLAKPFSPRELVARVRALLRRAQPVPAMNHGFTVDGSRVRLDGQLLNLTKLELGLLLKLLAAPQRIHSRDTLLDAVWGTSADSGDRTVDTHIKTLRAKLREAAPARDPIKTHRGLGYSLEPLMRLGLRVFFGFFLIAGLSAVLLLKVFLAEVKPSVREVMEDLMVDTANLLAEVAAEEMATGAPPADGRLAAQLQRYSKRDVDVTIWGVHKQTLDLRVYVTDANGRVVLDSGTPSAVGQDYSQWNDVARTLRGAYGARSSREQGADDRSTVLVVAAPIDHGGRRLGVVSVAKPVASVQRFIDRAESRVFKAGAALLAASLIVGVAVTLWLVATVRRLRRYAQQVQAGQNLAPPDVPGELGDLAHAMDAMRRRLEGREQLEHDVRALTHELKSPLAALRASGELLQDELPEDDRRRFAAQVLDQTARLQTLVERVLALSQLEAQVEPGERQRLQLADWADTQLERQAPRLAQQGLRVVWLERADVAVEADPALLELAFGNVLVNAIDFAPAGSTLELAVGATPTTAHLTLRDHGPGVPAAGFPQLGKRFFSTARPGSLVKGSGLGLAIARRVMELHGGRLAFEAAEPGLSVSLVLPSR